ncbi:MAG TPA: hypothetical protein VL995_15050 [Cellvibrio sp.]|nr:hypothetical protein [Cellvibrio sp.]
MKNLEISENLESVSERLQAKSSATNLDFGHKKQIEMIGNAPCLDTAIRLFKCASPLVRTYKFVFSSDVGTSPGFSVNRKFSKTAAVRSLFSTEKVFVVDEVTLREMSQGESKFRIDYSISLDNQALSYLEPFFEQKRSKIPADMIEVFEFISRPEVFVDPQPYMDENIQNLDSNEKILKIKKKLRSYEILRTLDLEALRVDNIVRTTLSDKKLEENTQKLTAVMFQKRRDKRATVPMGMRYILIYCQLLKMISIQMKSPQRSTHHKILDYLEFCHHELKALSFREISIAKKYFDEGNNFRFFKDIQKNRERLFEAINGMVWDLWHVRQLEENMVRGSRGKVRYFFPAILTFDKGLNEVMDLHPLKSIAFNASLKDTIPFYEGSFIMDIADADLQKASEIQHYFEREQVSWRELERNEKKRHKTEKVYMEKLLVNLEQELEKASGIKKPETLSIWYMSNDNSRISKKSAKNY